MDSSNHVPLRESRQLIEALNSALDLVGPVAKEVILELLQQQGGISLSEAKCSSKEDIERALYKAVGVETADLLVSEWDKRINKAKSSFY